MTLNGDGWYHLSELPRGITPKHHWFLLSELPSFFCNKTRCESHKEVCENKDFCNDVIPSKDNKLLKLKSDKAPFTNYADLWCLIEKIDGCKKNP